MKKKYYKNEIESLENKIGILSRKVEKSEGLLNQSKAELNATLKAFDEIRDELSYYKGFHDGVKNGAKVNFSPTINQPTKKEFASGGIMEHRCEKHKNELKPRPETVDNIMDFSAKLKESENKSTETKTEPVSNLQRIFENFIGSDAKGLIICAGEPPNEVLEALESALEKVPKTDDEQLKQTPENNDGLYRSKGTTACNPD